MNASYWEFLRYEDLKRGIIYLRYELENEELIELHQQVNYVRRLKVPKVTVQIASPGGDAYYSLGMYDVIAALAKDIPVEGVVSGVAASAASMIILQATTHRVATKHSRLLIHEVGRSVFFMNEKRSQTEDELKEMNALNQAVCQIVADRSGKSLEEVERCVSRQEVWMSADEALEWGLVDEVLP